MGSWFSNIHIRKNATVTAEMLHNHVERIMASKKYVPVQSEDDADGAVAIVAGEDCQWISVYSDLLSFEDPGKYTEMAGSLSAQLHTDVLGISCFDSDYLYLNLVNAEDNTDAWIGIGSAAGLGIKRRSGLSAWKKKVSNFETFSESVRKKYVFADEFLTEAELCLGLPAIQSAASYEYLKDFELDKKARFLYFKLPEDMKAKNPVKLVPYMSSGMPCFLGKPNTVSGINVGGESRGLSVYFLGPYVEKEELTFSDVCFVKLKNNTSQSTPIELTKVQLSDGQWAYYYHDPGFRIPPKANDELPMMQHFRVTMERSITVGFVPHGNPRKILDVTVVLVPDKNHAGQTWWNVWQPFGSKEAFIENFNESWKRAREFSPDAVPLLLKIEDFD